MAQPTKVELGAFAEGEVPPDLRITYVDFDGDPVNLAGFTSLQMNIEEELAGTTGFGEGTLAPTDLANGVVTYAWTRVDFQTIGEFQAQSWVDNGTKYHASDLYIYTVYDGPGAPPS